MAPLSSFQVEALLPSSIAPKLDSILHARVYPQLAHAFRAVARLKALLIHAILDLSNTRKSGHDRRSSRAPAKRKKMRSKMAGFFVKLQFFGTGTARTARGVELPPETRCTYEWHAAAAWEEEEVEVCGNGGTEAECGYLCWLEEELRPVAAEEGQHDAGAGEEGEGEEVNEIDRLAERFIARFHAKCLLEKQESYRRSHQQMLVACTTI